MSKYKIFLLLLALIYEPVQMMAVPALPVIKRLKKDGMEYSLTLRGDEFFHYWEDASGMKFLEKNDGSFRTLSFYEEQYIREVSNESRARENNSRMRKSHAFLNTLTGTKKGLVILVNFKDNNFSSSNPGTTYNSIFNQLNYTGYGMTGSVRDYFLAQSYGVFDMTLDVAGPYTLSNNMAYYGANDANGNDIGVQNFARESFKMADADVDFSKYDWNGDGTVEQVFIVYAGYAEAQGGAANTIWPHA